MQGELYEHLSTRSNWRPSGALDGDLPTLRSQLPRVLHAVGVAAPEPLAMEARILLEAGVDSLDQMLLAFWHAPSDRQFFAKAIVQPYAQGVAVPLVDEVAGAPLDVWASDHGYVKIELNLVGL